MNRPQARRRARNAPAQPETLAPADVAAGVRDCAALGASLGWDETSSVGRSTPMKSAASVGAGGVGDPQPVESQQRDQRMQRRCFTPPVSRPSVITQGHRGDPDRPGASGSRETVGGSWRCWGHCHSPLADVSLPRLTAAATGRALGPRSLAQTTGLTRHGQPPRRPVRKNLGRDVQNRVTAPTNGRAPARALARKGPTR
jgi:hypothetical protein